LVAPLPGPASELESNSNLGGETEAGIGGLSTLGLAPELASLFSHAVAASATSTTNAEDYQPARKVIHVEGTPELDHSMAAPEAAATRKKPGRKPAMQEPANKRTAQNRAAQRAFRERKEQYVRDLEIRVKSLESEKTELSTLVSRSNVIAAAAAAAVASTRGTPAPAAVTDENKILRQRITQLESENSMLRELSFSFDFSNILKGGRDAAPGSLLKPYSTLATPPQSTQLPVVASPLATSLNSPPDSAKSPAYSAASTGRASGSPPMVVDNSSSELFSMFNEAEPRWDQLFIPGTASSQAPPVAPSAALASVADGASLASLLLNAGRPATTPAASVVASPAPRSSADMLNAFLLGEASAGLLDVTSPGGTTAAAFGVDDPFAFLKGSPSPPALPLDAGSDFWMTRPTGIPERPAPTTSTTPSSTMAPTDEHPSHIPATGTEDDNGMCRIAAAAARSCLPQEDPKVIDDLCEIFKTKAQCTEIRSIQHKIVDACEKGDRDQVLELMEICKEKRRMRM
ncbi:hypothetical protein HK405_015302, partial [Cladochytrium tenue]